jgi:hypothetical protein
MIDRGTRPQQLGGKAFAARIPAWVALPAAAALIALVALASRPASGAPGSPSIDLNPALTVVEVIGYVGVAIGTVALVAGLAINRGKPRRLQAGGPVRRKELAPVPWWANVLGLAVIGSLVAIQVAVIINYIAELQRLAAEGGRGEGGVLTGLDPNAFDPRSRDLTSLSIALVIVSALAVLVVAVAIHSRLRDDRRAGADATDPRAPTVAAVELSLEALRREPDPRRAVIAAYAAMERSLSGAGFGRRRSEAPLEYLRRVLTATRAAEEVRTITLLFQHAKFSHHAVDETMRTGAIDALERIRATADAPA